MLHIIYLTDVVTFTFKTFDKQSSSPNVYKVLDSETSLFDAAKSYTVIYQNDPVINNDDNIHRF